MDHCCRGARRAAGTVHERMLQDTLAARVDRRIQILGRSLVALGDVVENEILVFERPLEPDQLHRTACCLGIAVAWSLRGHRFVMRHWRSRIGCATARPFASSHPT